MFRARYLTTQKEDNGLVAILRVKQNRNSSIFCSSLENDELKNKERKKRALLLCLIHITTETYGCPRKQKKKLNKKRARNKEQDRKTEKEFLRMRR